LFKKNTPLGSTFEGGYSSVPHSVTRNPDISIGAKAAYTSLLSYSWNTGRAWPSQARLAADLGVSRTSIHTWLSELQQHGLIAIKKRQSKNSPNVYIIERLEESSEAAPKSGHRCSESVQPRVQNLVTKNKQDEQETKKHTQEEPVVAELKDAGITEQVAAGLVLEYGIDACVRQMQWLHYRKARDKSALLVRAIQGQWAAPAALESATSSVTTPRTSKSTQTLAGIMQDLASQGHPGSKFFAKQVT